MKLKYVILLLLVAICSMMFAVDPWGEPVILTGSMTVMAQVSINGAPADNGDVLGAFVNVGGAPQLRGKGNIMVLGGIPGCLLQVYTETAGETISFKVWDESAQTEYTATQTLLSEVNGTVGSYPDNMYQITAGGGAMVDDPWPEPVILSGSMTVMAQVSINSAPATNGDILAAFVTVGGIEQLRGKSAVQVIGGVAGSLIQVFTESNGEVISFKVWDYSAQQIFTASNTLISEVNGSVGSYPDNMYQINAGGTTQQVATPTFNPPAGAYATAQNVTISCTTPGAQIRYTTDGSEPTETSVLYSTPVQISTTTT
ncbi:MAG TPA: chitobiase/beta-hexosaminidase C-terminal domain-containing protein, partial [Candidatus Cloacimonadota bacterium]|nr:chitobiase/beta-hexosaminidase C-terminal domain-containing protein [Candidatus Cloacimonadota bacterium]